jgi:3-hydroxyacyl-CoA dehydrogenase/3a,7a,12a-trihydroxy-5b-cholest-24-enoyl-CoA hydratase
MASGKANPMALFSGGKLKIGGNVMASQKLSFMQKMDREAALRDAIAAGKLGGGAAPAATTGTATATPAAAAPTKAAKAPGLFRGISEHLAKNPGLAGELGGTVQFKVKGPDGVWSIDSSGAVREGAAEAATTLTLSDDDLEALVSGAETVQSLYQHGKLRIDGDMGPARKLAVLKA